MIYAAMGWCVIPNNTRRNQFKNALDGRIAAKLDRWMQQAEEVATYNVSTTNVPTTSLGVLMEVRFSSAASRDDVVNEGIAWLNANPTVVTSGWIKTHDCYHDQTPPLECSNFVTAWSK